VVGADESHVTIEADGETLTCPVSGWMTSKEIRRRPKENGDNDHASDTNMDSVAFADSIRPKNSRRPKSALVLIPLSAPTDKEAADRLCSVLEQYDGITVWADAGRRVPTANVLTKGRLLVILFWSKAHSRRWERRGRRPGSKQDVRALESMPADWFCVRLDESALPLPEVRQPVKLTIDASGILDIARRDRGHIAWKSQWRSSGRSGE